MHIKKFSDACEQNKESILKILQEVFKDSKTVLEIGSGSGQHAVYFAKHLYPLSWQPSDLVENLSSIQAWMDEQKLANLKPPIELNVIEMPWAISCVDAVFSANSLHIMSWEMVEHFFKGVGEVLERNGKLLVYGPFSYQGVHTSASNGQFDQYLTRQDPLSGIRDFEDLDTLAKRQGLTFIEDYAMPVNNRCLLWERK